MKRLAHAEKKFCDAMTMETKAKQEERKRVYFFWDYDLTEEDVRAILRGDNETEKIWVMSRILNYALWDDIWNYIGLKDVREYFDRVWWRVPEIKEAWGHALKVWSNAN